MGVYPESFLAPMRSDIATLDARLARSAPVGDSKLAAPRPEQARHAAANAMPHHASGEGEAH
jgi:NADH-quinone oxidoreductase subunit M